MAVERLNKGNSQHSGKRQKDAAEHIRISYATRGT